MFILPLVSGCKTTPDEYLQSVQWVADSYKINQVEWIDSTNAYRQLRYTFYEDGSMFRSSLDTTFYGTYFHDEVNQKLLMMQEDTIMFTILTLNSVDLELAGHKGADSIYISAYH